MTGTIAQSGPEYSAGILGIPIEGKTVVLKGSLVSKYSNILK
jgi:hypothetical protein